MILHKGWNASVAIGIVEHRNVMIDSSSYPRASHICGLLLAEMCDDHGEVVVFGKMAEHGIVACMANVENQVDASPPLLDCQ